ncbi:MAG: RecX family transcriptional regulator [Bacteroidetes bacterium]|nr:MAG: RecX family transcriptional regulator [Bacteroidota bacterium]PTM08152.1 MAG: RecX family transcriptional regulator [Bacteroidota bacterium]
MPPKYLTKAVALQKLQRYCAYQDRCHQEVRTKLLELGVYGDTLEEVMAELITERFLDEERFAKSYARGKFRVKKWGRIRIQQELKMRKISAYCIKQGMAEIDEDAYRATLQEIISQKITHYGARHEGFVARQKAAQYALGRGYESSLVWDTLNELA